MSNTQPIEELRKQFHHEWLLITVQEMDEQTTTPLKGTLVDHASLPDPLWEKSATMSGITMVVYSDDWPEDLAACFIFV